MNANFNMSTRKTVVRGLSRVLADAVLGAASAGLYGLTFGGIGALAQHEAHRLLSVTSVFALCGAIAGLALGAYSAFSNAETESAAAPSDVAVNNEQTIEKAPVTAVHPLSATCYRRPQSSQVAV